MKTGWHTKYTHKKKKCVTWKHKFCVISMAIFLNQSLKVDGQIINPSYTSYKTKSQTLPIERNNQTIDC